MGMEMLKNSVPDIKQNPEVLAFLAQYTNLGFLSVLLFLFVGTILTVIVQSSSAMMAITLVMCTQGWISFEIAAAMVLGENIGTTITANVAALSANVSAKRAALSHTIFNVFGVIWLLIVFYPFTSMIKALVVEIGPTDPTQQDAFSLSLFHTMFNVCNVLILNWFAKFIAKTVTKLIPQSETDEEFRLAFISTGMLSTAELSILQAQKEMRTYTERVKRMFGIVKSLNEETNENAALKYFERVQKYELISDRMEMEIAAYLNKVSQGRLSNESKDQIHRMLRIVSEIESVADSCDNLAKILDRKRQGKISFTAEMVANIHNMLNLLDKAFDEMLNILDKIKSLQQKPHFPLILLENYLLSRLIK
jgi:phosphate:Na+ symporter